MNHDPFRSIAFQPRKDFREFWYRLAKLLKERHGSQIHLYASTKEEARYYRELDREGIFSSFSVTYAALMGFVREQGLDADEVFERARKMEAYTGTTINAIAATDRHLGRGYSPAGFYFPKSRISEETDYVQMVHGITEMLDFWDREIKEKGITLVMGGNKFQGIMARVHGLHFTMNYPSGFATHEYWSNNEMGDSDRLQGVFDKLEGVAPEIGTIDQPYQQYKILRTPILAQAKVSVLIKDLFFLAAKHYYGLLRGYDKSRMYLLSRVFVRKYRRWKGLRDMARPPFLPIDELEGKPFVLFPLQTEPEATISFASPNYLSQHHAVIQIARNLPAGMILAVKDHFLTVGRRPDDFYQQIGELKNVVQIDARAHGFEAIQHSIAVATVVGHPGFEAAVMGKPVVAFGKYNIINFLDHVFTVTDHGELRALLQGIVDGTAFDAEKAKADGLRFMNALLKISFEVGAYRPDGTPELSDAAVEEAYRTLCDTVATPRGQTRDEAQVA